MTASLLVFALLSTSSGFTAASAGDYVRISPDIQTLTVWDYVGPGIHNGSHESIQLQSTEYQWTYDKYCQGSTGSPSPHSWTSPVSSLYEGPDIDIQVQWGGVSLQGGWAYERRINLMNHFAQFEIIVEGGIPVIHELTIPAVETWDYEYEPGGSVNPELQLNRTVHNYGSHDYTHWMFFVGYEEDN